MVHRILSMNGQTHRMISAQTIDQTAEPGSVLAPQTSVATRSPGAGL